MADCGGIPYLKTLLRTSDGVGGFFNPMNGHGLRIRSIRLALMAVRRDWLREARGSYVTKSKQCSLLEDWLYGWVRLIEELQGILAMPKSKANEQISTWKGFKDFRLSADQLEAFATDGVHDDDLMDLVQASLAEGYKLTFTYNGQSDTYNAAMTCNDDKSGNFGYTMSAFGPTFYTAIGLLMYKHHILLEADWNNIPAPQRGGMG